MATIEEMTEYLKSAVSERRFIHSINTMETARQLAGRFNADRKKCEIAGLLHDCAKNITGSKAIEICEQRGIELDFILRRQTKLLHGILGRMTAGEEFGIEDEEVLDAIEHHTMGRPAMSMVEKIIFLADYIEPHRFFPGVEELRELAFREPDRAVVMAADGTIRKIIAKGELLHTRIVDTRNYYISITGEEDGI